MCNCQQQKDEGMGWIVPASVAAATGLYYAWTLFMDNHEQQWNADMKTLSNILRHNAKNNAAKYPGGSDFYTQDVVADVVLAYINIVGPEANKTPDQRYFGEYNPNFHYKTGLVKERQNELLSKISALKKVTVAQVNIILFELYYATQRSTVVASWLYPATDAEQLKSANKSFVEQKSKDALLDNNNSGSTNLITQTNDLLTNIGLLGLGAFGLFIVYNIVKE